MSVQTTKINFPTRPHSSTSRFICFGNYIRFDCFSREEQRAVESGDGVGNWPQIVSFDKLKIPLFTNLSWKNRYFFARIFSPEKKNFFFFFFKESYWTIRRNLSVFPFRIFELRDVDESLLNWDGMQVRGWNKLILSEIFYFNFENFKLKIYNSKQRFHFLLSLKFNTRTIFV